MSGIEGIKQTGNGIELFCDCGAITVLADGEPGEALPDGTSGTEHGTICVPASGGEVAFTCHGCGSAHWLTFGRLEDQP